MGGGGDIWDLCIDRRPGGLEWSSLARWQIEMMVESLARIMGEPTYNEFLLFCTVKITNVEGKRRLFQKK